MIDADRDVGDGLYARWQAADHLRGEVLGMAAEDGVGALGSG